MAQPTFPPTPTTRTLAIGTIQPGADLQQVRHILPGEMQATAELYLQEKIDQLYSLQGRPGVVFILNVTYPAMAKEMLQALPLGREHLMSFDSFLWFRLPPCANSSWHIRRRGRMTANVRTSQPFHLGDMTMKVLGISKWAKASSPEERDAILPKEVPATLKLYLDGVIEQMWFKLDAPAWCSW